MTAFDTHLDIIRAVVNQKEPVRFDTLAVEVERRAKKKKLRTSESYIARVVLATTVNNEPVHILYPELPKILLVMPNGRYTLFRE